MRILTYAIMLLVAMLTLPVAVVFIGTLATIGTIARWYDNCKLNIQNYVRAD